MIFACSFGLSFTLTKDVLLVLGVAFMVRGLIGMLKALRS